jgi:hypothetical protein
MDNYDDSGEEPLDANYSESDIHPDTLQRMAEDCENFQSDNLDLLRDLDDSQSGHDFWLTRNHHGAGFWDRGLGKLGDQLTEAAHAWGSFDLYVGDDEQIHGS